MIEGYGAVTQALLGTLLTWGLTAAGAGLVVFLRGNHVSMAKKNERNVIHFLIVFRERLLMHLLDFRLAL
jgi:hypothetical protein